VRKSNGLSTSTQGKYRIPVLMREPTGLFYAIAFYLLSGTKLVRCASTVPVVAPLCCHLQPSAVFAAYNIGSEAIGRSSALPRTVDTMVVHVATAAGGTTIAVVRGAAASGRRIRLPRNG
jgi:hypothetical protein